MTKKIKPRIPQGMRDILPGQMIKRQYVIDVVKGIFEEFGFEPLQTPVIELSEILKGKYGEDAERLIYNTYYGGKKKDELSLRYDLSVPLCRVVAMYPEIVKPFKRYQIAPVYRADRPQKGRYREIYQCDADTVGSSSMLADAETINIIYEILTRLGFENFIININHRKILKGIGQFAGVPESLLGGLYRSIDKIGKIGLTGVERELKSIGLPEDILESLVVSTRLMLQGKLEGANLETNLREQEVPDAIITIILSELLSIVTVIDKSTIKAGDIQEEARRIVGQLLDSLRDIYKKQLEIIPDTAISNLLTLLQISGSNLAVLSTLRNKLVDYPDALEGVSDLEEVVRHLDNLGIPKKYFTIDFSMVRGLEYYTGPIYETIVKEPNIGSITGGGRFDELVGMFIDRSYPATGTTIGLERIIDVMEEKDMFPAHVHNTVSEVLVSYFDENTVNESLKLASRLRKGGLKTEMYFEKDALRDQIGYASTKGIPFVVILGPDEISDGQVTVKNMSLRKQKRVNRSEVVNEIRSWMEANSATE